MSITVKAKETGFYLTMRAAGDVFAIESEQYLGRWMEVVDVAVADDVDLEPPADNAGASDEVSDTPAVAPAKPGKK